MTSSPRNAFTLLEILCCIAIIGVLTGLVGGIYSHIAESRNQAKCLHNLTQVAIAVHAYAQDHEGRFPYYKNFDLPLEPYAHDRRVFLCPSADDFYKGSHRADGLRNDYSLSAFTMEGALEADGMWHVHSGDPALAPAVSHPARKIMANDATYRGDPREADWPGIIRHFSGANYVFIDGHAELLTPQAANALDKSSSAGDR